MVVATWPGAGNFENIIAAVQGEGVTDPDDIARELIERAKPIFEARQKQADVTQREGGDVTQRGKPGDVTQDTQDTQIPNDSQDSHRHPSDGCAAVSEGGDGGNAASQKDTSNPLRDRRRERMAWFEKFVSVPWESYLAKCWEFSEREKADSEYGDWRSPLFTFVWLLKGHKQAKPFFSKPKLALSAVEKTLRGWSRDYRQRGKEPPHGYHAADCWADWFGVDKADAQADFINVWQKIRYLPGQGPLDQALDAATREPLGLPPALNDMRPDDYGRFISVAGHLQVIVGDKNVHLPCRQIGQLLNVSHNTVAAYCRWGATDKFLTKIKDAKFTSRGKGDAAEYRFNVACCPLLKGRAQGGGE